ncbi:MAG TPA: hypothetical protein VLE27_14380 [Thermoanaerobaculia bacterium]|nr:hypothetical protein [Thermoanaerobaculia bacterium]
MNIVAVHYAPGQGEAMVETLAGALDKTLYEARARLSAPEGGPVVVASFAEIEPAWAFAGRLRVNGIRPILLTPDDIESEAQRFLVRGFEIGERGLTAFSRRGETAGVAWQDVDLLLRGTRIAKKVETEDTGGFQMTRARRQPRQVTREERDDFLHLYSMGHPPLVFRANDLDYRSLGPALHPSVAENFGILLAELRRLLPHARYDERLVNRLSRARVLGPSLTEDHLDIAVSLVARVLRS